MSHRLSGAGALSLLLLLAFVPSSANGAADVAVAEVPSSSAIAVHRDTLAWIDDGDGAVVLRRPDGRTRRFTGRGVAESVSLGQDRHGRLVLVFARCRRERRCTLRRVDVRSGRNRAVPGIRGPIYNATLRRGLLVWVRGFLGSDVRMRALAGGAIRRQAVGRRVGVEALDHDGRRLAFIASPDGVTPEQTQLRLVTLGSRRVRTLRTVSMGEETRTEMRNPMLLPHAVEVADGDAEEASYQLTRVPIRHPRRRIKRDLGAFFTAVARGGGRTAYVDAPSYVGCGSLLQDEDDEELQPGLVAGGCRIVLAGRGVRTLPVALVRGERVAEPGGGYRIEGKLVQSVGKTEMPVAGRQITILVAPQSDDVSDATEVTYPASGPQVTTGPDGRWSATLPAAAKKRYVGAVTVDAPRTWIDEMFVLPAAP